MKNRIIENLRDKYLKKCQKLLKKAETEPSEIGQRSLKSSAFTFYSCAYELDQALKTNSLRYKLGQYFNKYTKRQC